MTVWAQHIIVPFSLVMSQLRHYWKGFSQYMRTLYFTFAKTKINFISSRHAWDEFRFFFFFCTFPFPVPLLHLTFVWPKMSKNLNTIKDFVENGNSTTLSLTAVKKKTMHVIHRIYSQSVSHQVEEDVEWDIRVYTYSIRHVLGATHVWRAQLCFSLFPICIGLLRHRAQGSQRQLRPHHLVPCSFCHVLVCRTSLVHSTITVPSVGLNSDLLYYFHSCCCCCFLADG